MSSTSKKAYRVDDRVAWIVPESELSVATKFVAPAVSVVTALMCTKPPPADGTATLCNWYTVPEMLVSLIRALPLVFVPLIPGS